MELVTADLKQRLRDDLEAARRRTWLLADGLPDKWLDQPAASYLSPPNWDLGHIANFEELWLVQELGRRPELRDGYNDTYNAFAHPREERLRLRLLDRDGVRRYMEEVRERSLAILDEVDLDASRLTRGGFVHRMLALHEQQHQETLLQSFTMRATQGRYEPPAARPLPTGEATPAWIDVPAGAFEMGAERGPGVYDNEARPHTVEVPAFQIAKYPVTNGEYLRFIEAGGYEDDRWWSDRGRQWLADEAHHAPLYWRQDEGVWQRSGMTGTAAVAEVPDEILCHVTYFEAEAYAAWAGARLPTEAEWEKACRWSPEGQGRNPWGDEPATAQRANIDQLGLQPSTIGAYADGTSPLGVEQMIGDVWEWCDSGFEAYPGFEAFPYEQYSKVFFGGDYRILRGGSWAACAGCSTGSFRNWDHPYRRQVFTGLRLARDP